MKQGQLDNLLAEIRRQHEFDLESLLDHIRREIPIDEDTIPETPKGDGLLG